MEPDLKYHFNKELKATRRIALIITSISLFVYGLLLFSIFLQKPSDGLSISGTAAIYHNAMLVFTRIGPASLVLFFLSLTITLMIVLSNYELKMKKWFVFAMMMLVAVVVAITYMLGGWMARIILHYEGEINAFFSAEIRGWDMSVPLQFLALFPIMIPCVLIAMLMLAAVMIPIKLPDFIVWIENEPDVQKYVQAELQDSDS